MLKALLAGAATVALMASAAHAAPVFCTGTTTVVASGTFVPASSLVGTGNCVEASDKVFGGFSVSGAISGGGSTGFLFTMPNGPANVTLGFQGLVGSNLTGSINYDVAVDPLNSNGALISELEKDFTFNSLGAGSTATLTGTTTPIASAFQNAGGVVGSLTCTRTATTNTCPMEAFYTPLDAMLAVTETLTTGPNTNVTAITDTVFQASPVSEPTSMAMLATALLGMGLFYRRQQQRR